MVVAQANQAFTSAAPITLHRPDWVAWILLALAVVGILWLASRGGGNNRER